MLNGTPEKNTLPNQQLRFFAAPNADAFKNHPLIGPRLNPDFRSKNRSKKRKTKMRYVAYVRISSEEQIGNYSLDAQKRAIESWVIANDGILTQVYSDEGHSGRTANRPAFKQMRQDARKRKFDAIIVHKFDRFAEIVLNLWLSNLFCAMTMASKFFRLANHQKTAMVQWVR